MEAFDEQLVDQTLRGLEPWRAVAFMALLCERMALNYRRFHDETGFGNPAVLCSALEAIWEWIESGTRPEGLAELREACEEQAPDTERFNSRYTSAALDAASAVATTLDAIESPEHARPGEVAALARDTIDLYVQELENLDPSSPEFEQAILRHSLMQRELRHQRMDLDELTTKLAGRRSAVRALRSRSHSPSLEP